MACQFSSDEDSPILPIWVEFPSLPANFYNEPMLLSIAGTVGNHLKVDHNFLYLTRSTATRVCVQFEPQVWISCGGWGFGSLCYTQTFLSFALTLGTRLLILPG